MRPRALAKRAIVRPLAESLANHAERPRRDAGEARETSRSWRQRRGVCRRRAPRTPSRRSSRVRRRRRCAGCRRTIARQRWRARHCPSRQRTRSTDGGRSPTLRTRVDLVDGELNALLVGQAVRLAARPGRAERDRARFIVRARGQDDCEGEGEAFSGHRHELRGGGPATAPGNSEDETRGRTVTALGCLESRVSPSAQAVSHVLRRRSVRPILSEGDAGFAASHSLLSAQAPRSPRDMTPTVDILIQQAQLADREGRRDDARALYERALFSLERRADAPIASSLLRWIGRLHRQAGDVDAALEASTRRSRSPSSPPTRRRSGRRSRAGRCVSAARPSRSRGGALSGGAVARHRCTGDAPRRDGGAEPQRHRDGARRPRQGAARSPREPRRVPRARRSEGGARLPSATWVSSASDLERWDDSSRAFDEAAQIAEALGDIPERVLIEVKRAALEIARGDFVAAAAACETGARALGADTGGRCRRRDREAFRHDRARDGRAGGRRRALRARAGDRRRATRPPAVGGDGARARGDCAASRDVIAMRSCNSTAAIASSPSSPSRENGGPRSPHGAPRAAVPRDRAPSGRVRSNRRTGTRRVTASAWPTSRARSRLRAGCESRELFWFRMGATVHDVGKLIIPSDVLNKPGKLAPDEWELIRRHPGRRRRDARRDGLSRRRQADGPVAPRAVGRPRLSRQPGR